MLSNRFPHLFPQTRGTFLPFPFAAFPRKICEPCPKSSSVCNRRSSSEPRRAGRRGDSASHHRREGARHRAGWKIFSDGRAQGGRGVWLSRAAARERRVRSGEAQGGVAFDGELLSRRRV